MTFLHACKESTCSGFTKAGPGKWKKSVDLVQAKLGRRYILRVRWTP